MDKAAIDDKDDFGLPYARESRRGRAAFTLGSLAFSVVFSAICLGIDLLILNAVTPGADTVQLAGRALPLRGFQIVCDCAVGISQIVWAYSGAVAIILCDRWGWAKYSSGSAGRILFEAVKWTSVVALLLLDAGFLERAYEAAYI